MNVASVNIGRRQTQARGPELEITGIYKRPAEGAIAVTKSGVVGDFIGDARNHGGPDQAVYVYGMTDYEWWKGELGRALDPGTFGENLSIAGLESAGVQIGDRLYIGQAVVEVTAARIPCSTLSRRMQDFKFAAAFRAAERPGFYCRVITPGNVGAGDAVRIERYAGESISVLEMFREHYRRNKTAADLQRLLRAPISVRARHSLQSELDQVLSASGA